MKLIHFADDSTLYAKGNSLSDLAPKINTELHKVVKLLQFNRFSLNVLKSFLTEFISVSQANLPAHSINGINLVHSPTTKFIGICIDNKLKSAPHIRDIYTKVSRGIGVCKKLTLMMSFTAMRKLFFTLIYSFWHMTLKYGVIRP